MASRLRILFAALVPPYPLTNGHRLRTSALIRALVEDGHELSLVSFRDGDDPNGGSRVLGELCRSVELVLTPTARRSTAGEMVGRVRALGSLLPYGVWRFRSGEFRQALERHLAGGRFDLIVCDGVYNVQNLPDRSPVPVLLNKDDVAHLILERYAKLERRPARRAYAALEAWKVRRWEGIASRRMSGILACSEFDRGVLQRLCSSVPVFVVPNVVDTAHYTPREVEEPFTVLFQGGMDWYPNRDAVEFFVAQVFPELRRRVPEARFRVAGRCPADEFRRRLASVAGVEFTGTVPDMRDETARATVCVVPLRIGSGTRLKILEAGAMGKPIVSTRLGAEGLEFVDGHDVILADEPAEFAGAVAALLSSGARRRQLGRAARLRVEREYSFPVLRSCVRKALVQVVEPRRAGRPDGSPDDVGEGVAG